MRDTLKCFLCGRDVPEKAYIEKHHLIPSSEGGKQTELACNACGDQIHMLFDNKQLRDTYNTLDKLREHPDIQKWIRWVRKQKNFRIRMKFSRKR